MRSTIVRKISFVMVALCAIVGLVVVSGCGESDGVLPESIREKVLPPPSIGISFREGFLSDAVMQVHNISDKRIMIHIHVSYPPTSEEKIWISLLHPTHQKSMELLN